ncbi:hypothetical protein SEVIR_9G335900v4 [Setaria viridis]|uniref:uncharacterized protein isoform X2 n=1 Tax=Setaria viridis TaxID=4556 RepID=UPI0014939A15|nr:uncharacterized protein LOC117838422 isoform X3 [Setaria viridis]
MRPVSRDIGNNVLDTSDLQCTSKLTVDGHYWVLMQPLSAQVYNFLVNLINIPEHIATVCRLRGKRASVFFTIGFEFCNAAIKWTDQGDWINEKRMLLCPIFQATCRYALVLCRADRLADG